MTEQGKAKLDRFQIWAFVAGGVVAVLTFPAVGILFGLAAVALTYRVSLPAARWAGLAVAALCVLITALGVGGADGGGLID